MKTQFRFIVLAMLIPLTTMSVKGQSYGFTAGLRLGNGQQRTIGLSTQYRLAKHLTLEGIAQTDFSHEHTAHLLIKEHQPFLTKRFNIFFGTGMSFGSERSKVIDEKTSTEVITVGNETIGLDLMAGLELTLLSYTLSVDVKPNINIVGREPWIENQVGVSVRSVIVSGAEQNKRSRKRERAKRKKEREKRREEREPLLGDWFQDLFKKD